MPDAAVSFPMPEYDSRPLPEIIAATCGFPLSYHDIDGVRYYAVQDWIAGVAQTESPSDYWVRLKQRVKRSGIELSTSCVQLSYLAANGKRYKMDHVDNATLFMITQRMDATSALRNKILEYFTKIVGLVDEMRMDPDQAIEAAIAGYRRIGKSDKWIMTHVQVKTMRFSFNSAFQSSMRVKPGQKQFAIITDEMRLGLWRRKTATLKQRMSLGKNENLRDNMSSLALSYELLAENISATELEMKVNLEFDDCKRIVRSNATHVGNHAEETGKRLGIDIATDRPLLLPAE